MANIEQTFQDVISRIWTEAVGTELTKVDLADAPLTDPLSASVPFLGDWEGDIEVQVDEDLARTVGAKMLFIDPDDLSDDDLKDALGEVTNMIGGSLRASLSTTCGLGTPTVVGPGDLVMRSGESTVLFAHGYLSNSQPIRITLRAEQGPA
ncbi:MAG: chemotaxis protein CheX [Bradymonadia bacterium]|jgi:chemotaxis protein CheX